MTSLSTFIYGQKGVEKLLEDPSLTQIFIDAAQFSSLQLSSKVTKTLSVKAHLEGEYSEHQLLSFVRKGNTLFISPNFSDDFKLPNDKLGAHKVFAIDVRAEIPEHMEVIVSGGTLQLTASGNYKKLQIRLNEGYCGLEKLAGTVSVFTTSAPIFLKQSSGQLTAQSTYGQVFLEPIQMGPAIINLSSVSGDIRLLSQQP